MDNEASTALKTYFIENDVSYQHVLPHCHICNRGEREIHTFIEYFGAGLESMDPYFPRHLWDRIFPQAEMTLNLLRTSRLHPYMSAAVHLYGPVDYNKTTFSPPECKIIAQEKPQQRRTWAPRGKHGYSLGPAMQRYRCQNMYITSTTSKRIVDTLEMSSHNSPMPQIYSTDRLRMAAQDMTDALKHLT
jgi:hypothetical protein